MLHYSVHFLNHFSYKAHEIGGSMRCLEATFERQSVLGGYAEIFRVYKSSRTSGLREQLRLKKKGVGARWQVVSLSSQCVSDCDATGHGQSSVFRNLLDKIFGQLLQSS